MIAYYAHQEGSGHANFAQLWATCSPHNIIVFTSSPYNFSEETRVIRLESEDPDGTALPASRVDLPSYLHYSPVGQESIQRRSACLLRTCVEEGVKMVIVDVSVEIAALCRASSMPYAYVRLPGMRTDAAHLEAFRGAFFLLAYYPAALEPTDTPRWICQKTVYLGFISRYVAKGQQKKPVRFKKLAILSGRGDNSQLNAALPVLFKRFWNKTIDVFGDFASETRNEIPPRVHFHGFKQDIESYIQGADLVITNCGMNVISEMLNLKKRVLAVPEKRPYGEQQVFYKMLLGANVICGLEATLVSGDLEILKGVSDPSPFLSDKKLHRLIDRLIAEELTAVIDSQLNIH